MPPPREEEVRAAAQAERLVHGLQDERRSFGETIVRFGISALGSGKLSRKQVRLTSLEQTRGFGQLQCFLKCGYDLFALGIFEQIHRQLLEPALCFPVFHRTPIRSRLLGWTF